MDNLDRNTDCFDAAPSGVRITCKLIADAVRREIGDTLGLPEHFTKANDCFLHEGIARFIYASGINFKLDALQESARSACEIIAKAKAQS